MNIMNSKIDIATIVETKIDDKVFCMSVYMSGYQIPFRLDRVSQWGGIFEFIRDDIHCKIIKTDCDAGFEVGFQKMVIYEKKLFFCSEAVARRCSVKRVFLKILQNSQENTCVRVSFLVNLQASACNFI